MRVQSSGCRVLGGFESLHQFTPHPFFRLEFEPEIIVQTEWDVIIVGAGAAGLWAAGTAAQRGRKVLLLEKNNKAGVKILMSGGTRCNITHNCDSRKIAEAFGRQGKVLLSVLKRLTPEDVVHEFHALGVATKVEETGKVFPASDRALDVRDALVRRLQTAGAFLRTGASVLQTSSTADGGFTVHARIDGYLQNLNCTSLLITTGGLSYSGCGTTGDGYPWVKRFGHTVTPLRPALTPLLSDANWVHELSGLTLDDVTVTAKVSSGNSPLSTERNSSRGGFLWTHFGCSGPTAMNVSRCFADLETGTQASIHLDLLPAMSRTDCEKWFTDLAKNGNRTVENLVATLIPRRLTQCVMQHIDAPESIRLAEFSKRHRNLLIERLKALAIPIHGTRGYPKAEVTAGGVELGEINFQDMQSRKQPGLFLAGEILDLDGPIGGFNFQAAWSTGHAAGLAV